VAGERRPLSVRAEHGIETLGPAVMALMFATMSRMTPTTQPYPEDPTDTAVPTVPSPYEENFRRLHERSTGFDDPRRE
jgi:hypothetical protein